MSTLADSHHGRIAPYPYPTTHFFLSLSDSIPRLLPWESRELVFSARRCRCRPQRRHCCPGVAATRAILRRSTAGHELAAPPPATSSPCLRLRPPPSNAAGGAALLRLRPLLSTGGWGRLRQGSRRSVTGFHMEHSRRRPPPLRCRRRARLPAPGGVATIMAAQCCHGPEATTVLTWHDSAAVVVVVCCCHASDVLLPSRRPS